MSRKLGKSRAKDDSSTAATAEVFCARLLTWFRSNARDLPWRHKVSRYRALITEKLLQQTDVAHVLIVYREFFKRFPSLASLSSAKVEEIEDVIRPLGFWRQRADQLKRMSTILVGRHHSKIPNSRKALLELPGVGRYIANSFLSVACSQSGIAVDVNVRSVSRRLLYWPGITPSDEELESLFKKTVPASKTKVLNWAIYDFAALVCQKHPRCDICFATSICRYYRDSRSDED